MLSFMSQTLNQIHFILIIFSILFLFITVNLNHMQIGCNYK